MLQGDEYTYNTLVKVFAYAGDAKRALQVVSDSPTPFKNELLHQCIPHGNHSHGLSYLKHYENLVIRGEVSFLHVLDSMTHLGVVRG